MKAVFLARARAEGFDAVRVTMPDAVPEIAERLGRWLAAGRHGSMGWMAERAVWRSAPGALWPEARSVVMLGLNYGQAGDPLAGLAAKDRGNISVYARGDDYHDLVKGKLKRLGQWLAHQAGADIKVFVDTAPVMEKPLAAAAGLGWQGKHTNLVSRDFGSWLFLGAIFTTAALPADAAETDHCGTCRACLDACPTAAFPSPYQLDARRCISYLTIEHDGPIPHEFRRAIGNRIYGCDDCLAVCPWNKFAAAGHEARLAARAELVSPALADLAALDDAGFRTLFRKSPVKRIGRDRFVRNVMIAVGNSGMPALAAAARDRLADPSPAVRGAAVWALGELLGIDALASVAAIHRPGETDGAICAEWDAALAARDETRPAPSR
ncbi:MAG TPA: tRNA epoxyqueuosine(34) reductase QueG [Hyphomicrobiales bacterium]|nr:tRNA epoxyqueuosine(34) reductase QueG [Hyphomicrobiales bacterium]